MFEQFDQNFPRDEQAHHHREVEILGSDIRGMRELLSKFGGGSFRGGLYRVISPDEINKWNERICAAFPQFDRRITCFGFDWLGSTFAVDSGRIEDGQRGVVMFEPGTGDALEIPANLVTFHNAGLFDFGEAALAISFYEKWRSSGGAAPTFSECIGYKRPLFLGGKDEIRNLELSDLDVYWHIAGQLIRKAAGLPGGTQVRLHSE